MRKGIVHISHPGGHRKAYLNLFVSILNFSPIIGSVSTHYLELIKADKVLFATVGTNIRRYFLIGFIRSLLGKKTCTIFLGAMQYRFYEGSFSNRLNRFLSIIWKFLPFQNLLAIIPYSIAPSLSKNTTDFIFDPQMWDLWYENNPEETINTELSELVKERSDNKKILIYIGKGSKHKSFHELLLFAKSNSDDFYVVAAGQILDECSNDALELKSMGMMVVDRFISNEELYSLYGVANFAWCFYYPIYDQASGIFGRAVQLGVTPIVRNGSIIAKMSEKYGVPIVKLNLEDFQNVENKNDIKINAVNGQSSFQDRKETIYRMRDESLIKLKKSLN